MSRAAAYTLLKSNEELRQLGFAVSSFYRSVSARSPEERPFAILRWGNETPAFGSVSSAGSEILTIWVYDEPGDYGRIDKAILAIRRIFADALHVVGEDGFTLTSAGWNGNSEDLYDDIFECITRNVVFTVVGRQS